MGQLLLQDQCAVLASMQAACHALIAAHVLGPGKSHDMGQAQQGMCAIHCCRVNIQCWQACVGCMYNWLASGCSAK